MDAITFDDINAAQLRKLAHARTAVCREPRTPTLGRITFGARQDCQCGTQYRVDFIVGERLRFASLAFLGHLHAPTDEGVTRDQLFMDRSFEHGARCANPNISYGPGGPLVIDEAVGPLLHLLGQ
jgi:hypothetical protein